MHKERKKRQARGEERERGKRVPEMPNKINGELKQDKVGCICRRNYSWN